MSDGKTNGSFGIKLPFEFNKDKLALLVGGMAVIALIFATYNFFNKSSDITSTQTERTNDTIELKDDFKTGTDKGEIKDKAATINPTSTSNSLIGPVWTANDYQEGDIKGSSYTVVRGDTLWEISEAVYGDGTQWHKILEANKTKVGFLPNGSQALIVPGQILALP